MRIVHVTDCYLPRVGGIEVQVHGLATHQQAAGHDAEIWTTTPGVPELPASDLPVHRLPSLAGAAPSASALAGLRRELRSGRIDAVHVHASVVSPLAWAAAAAAAAAGLPCVVTMHSLVRSRSALLRLSRGLGWTRWPVRFTAVSQVAAAPLRELGLDVAVLPNGVDVDRWRPAAPADRPSGEVRLVSVMRLARRKRPAALAAVLGRIRELAPETRLRAVVVGDGPQRADLERQLRRHRVTGWVQLAGALSPPQVRDVLHGCDLYLAPAHRESFGIAALEARCAGLPLVAMTSGGVGEFVQDGVDGLLVGSDNEMASAAAGLIRSGELWAMRRHNLRVPPANVSWPQIVARNLRCYQEAAALADRGLVPAIA